MFLQQISNFAGVVCVDDVSDLDSKTSKVMWVISRRPLAMEQPAMLPPMMATLMGVWGVVGMLAVVYAAFSWCHNCCDLD